MKIIQKLLNWYLSINALPYWVILVVDSLICYLSGIFVFWMYYHGAIAWENMVLLTKTIFMYMVFNLIGFRLFRTYSGIIRYSSFVDLQRVALAMVLSLSIAEVMHYVIYHWNLEFVRLEGRQIAAMYLVATIGMMLFRILVKSLYDVVFNTDKGLRTLIYGVKDGGVGFIAHDPTLGGRILMGEKVYMADEDLAKYIKVLKIQAVLVSPLQNDKFRNDLKLQDTLLNLGVRIFMSSGEKEWNQNDDYTKVQLKEISIEDLLPRDQIHVDMDSIGNLLRGKKIMITGSAGSIGSEMVRQIAVYNPTELILIDQAETPQHNIRLMMHFEWPNIPDYVFHAAAYKHVPMMENNPSESIQNNILGTKVIADLSVKYGVKKFVMISTDKAVNPTNVMGCSKRICEIYCQSLNKMINEHAGDKPVTQFVTTRFGNVLGSNGSVIPLFEKQIKNGGPVTVTDPNIIRFFMLIPEACKLVLEAGTHGSGGEIFVFDMGKPVKIADLAKRMIKLSGAKDIEIKYTGLRAGEKLYEEVLSTTENTLPSFHEKIRIAKVREYDYSEVSKQIDSLIALSHTYDDMAIVEKMKEIVPEYVSNNSKYSVLDKK